MKQILFALLGFVCVFAYGLSFAGTITELWYEEYTHIYFAYVEDGILKAKPGFESSLKGYMPRNVLIDRVEFGSDSEEFKRFIKVQEIRL